jgi:hypothetical protein
MTDKKDQVIKDLKAIRNYFGEHDKTLFEHKAYAVLDNLIQALSALDQSEPNKDTGKMIEGSVPEGKTKEEITAIEIKGFVIYDPGDPSVGIFPTKYEVKGSFYFDSNQDLQDFQAALKNLFDEYVISCISSISTFEQVDAEEKFLTTPYQAYDESDGSLPPGKTKIMEDILYKTFPDIKSGWGYDSHDPITKSYIRSSMQLYSDQEVNKATAPLLDKIRELEGLCKTAYYDASPMMKPQDNINKDFTKKHDLNPLPSNPKN